MSRPKTIQTEDEALVALIPTLTPLARRLGRTRAEAEDLLQEALIAILARMRAGARIEKLPAYGRIVLKNAARRALRVQIDDALDLDSAAGALPSGEDTYAALEAIGKLPPEQARLLRAALEGHDTVQLARAEGIAPGTVHSRLARARARLRAELDLE